MTSLGLILVTLGSICWSCWCGYPEIDLGEADLDSNPKCRDLIQPFLNSCTNEYRYKVQKAMEREKLRRELGTGQTSRLLRRLGGPEVYDQSGPKYTRLWYKGRPSLWKAAHRCGRHRSRGSALPWTAIRVQTLFIECSSLQWHQLRSTAIFMLNSQCLSCQNIRYLLIEFFHHFRKNSNLW